MLSWRLQVSPRFAALALVGAILVAKLLLLTAAISQAGTTGFALHGESLFLRWPRKSNQEEGHPNIRPGALRRVPSLHRRSRGRLTRAIHGPLSLSPHPCGSLPSTTITLGLLTGNRVSSVSSRLSLTAVLLAEGSCIFGLHGAQIPFRRPSAGVAQGDARQDAERVTRQATRK